MRPYQADASCKQDGSICICSYDFAVTGVDDDGFNILKKQTSASACQQWTFKVGDVILVERPSVLKQAYIPAYVVSTVSNSPVVHTAIVTKVPSPGINQTADNIIVTEALKGNWKRVVQGTFRNIVERFSFGGVSIRRVDAKRFPIFFSDRRQKEITQWANAKVGEGFDEDMLIPIKRRFAAGERYIPIDPSCKDRLRAIEMYKRGGPGKWICSEFVGWTLAFPGGINTDYGLLSDKCQVPSWTVKNIQPLPGQLTDMDFFDQRLLFHMPCTATGCFVGVPVTPDWAGGTMTTTTTTTTVTSTSTTKSSTTSASTATSAAITSTASRHRDPLAASSLSAASSIATSTPASDAKHLRH